MRKGINSTQEMRQKTGLTGMISAAIFMLVMALYMNSCSKDESSLAGALKAYISGTIPGNHADSVFVDPVVSVVYKDNVATEVLSSTVITLKKGIDEVPGSTKISGKTITFIAESDLAPETEYTASVKSTSKDTPDGAGKDYSWRFKTGKYHQMNSLTIVSVSPVDRSGSVPTNTQLIINFNKDLTDVTKAGISVAVQKGTANVEGTVTYDGKMAVFHPTSGLDANSLYSCKVLLGTANNSTVLNSFTWSFTTAGTTADKTAPQVNSVFPVNNAASVVTSTSASVTFSEAMNPASVNSSTFTLKSGTTAIAGTVACFGLTATFIPSAPLASNTDITGTITTGAKDAAGNALAAAYSWTFHTATAPDVTPPTVTSVTPVNASATAPLTTKPAVTFSEAMNPGTITTATFILKQGSVTVAGTVAYSGSTATFTPAASLQATTLYTGTITTGAKDASGNALASDYTWSFTTSAAPDVTPPTIISVVPANNASSVATGSSITANFSEAMGSASITSSTFTMKQGATSVAGSVTYSGTAAVFMPTTALAASTLYTCTVTTGVKDAAGNSMASDYTWSFTTTAAADVTPPTVVSVTPANNAVSVSTGTNSSATFSEAMSPASITASTFTMKHGSTAVTGTVTYSGATATFTPSAALTASTLYTCTITTGAKDATGNSMTSNYTWSFTTAAPVDVTPPTVTSVTPVNNATSVATGSSATANFSEAMKPSSITSSTFTMKQGSTAVAGTVTYSGTTATFTPSAALTGSTVYTCTITTGAQDAAGNALASNYSWNFTTVAVVTPKSFSADVVPILNICNSCHTHPWTTSSNASTFYNNLVSGGYVNTTTPTSSKIYTKLNGGHPGSVVTTAQVNTILTWFTEGAKNN